MFGITRPVPITELRNNTLAAKQRGFIDARTATVINGKLFINHKQGVVIIPEDCSYMIYRPNEYYAYMMAISPVRIKAI
jgi:hypothetical protein